MQMKTPLIAGTPIKGNQQPIPISVVSGRKTKVGKVQRLSQKGVHYKLMIVETGGILIEG
jgi:hypothetical protein